MILLGLLTILLAFLVYLYYTKNKESFDDTLNHSSIFTSYSDLEKMRTLRINNETLDEKKQRSVSNKNIDKCLSKSLNRDVSPLRDVSELMFYQSDCDNIYDCKNVHLNKNYTNNMAFW